MTRIRFDNLLALVGCTRRCRKMALSKRGTRMLVGKQGTCPTKGRTFLFDGKSACSPSSQRVFCFRCELGEHADTQSDGDALGWYGNRFFVFTIPPEGSLRDER